MKPTGDKRTKKQRFFSDKMQKHRSVWIGLAAAMFAAAAVFGVGKAALEAQSGRLAASKLRYEEQEEAYVERARKILEEAGLNKAGVMLEYRQEADQTRSYTLYVHHRRWNNLGEKEKGRLEKELEDSAFKEKNCRFSCDFSG